MPANYRSRTQGGFTPVALSGTINRYQMPSYPYPNPYLYPVGTRAEMVDFVNKPFVKGKTWVNNPMVRSETTYAVTPGMLYGSTTNTPQVGDNISWETQYAGEFDTDFLEMRRASPLYDFSNLNTEAATKALSRIRAPEVNGLVSLGELRETLSYIRNPFAGAVKVLEAITPSARRKAAYDSLRTAIATARTDGRRERYESALVKLKLLHAKRGLTAAAETHLSVIFGAMPLIDDVKGLLKVLRDGGTEFHFSPITARGSASSSATTTKTITLYGWVPWTLSHTRTVSCRAYSVYEERQGFTTTSARLGFDLSLVPVAAWQLVPYSFLADWGFNVSNYLSSLRPKTGVDVKAEGLVVTIVDAWIAKSSSAATSGGGWTYNCTPASRARVDRRNERVPAHLGDYSGIVLKASAKDLLEDLYKVSASISLLTQKLSKFRI